MPHQNSSSGRHPARTAPLLEPAAQAFADAAARRPYLFELGPIDGRSAFIRAQHAGALARPDVEITDVTIEGGLVGQVPARIVRPRHTAAAPPAIVYIHGGGWVFGDHRTHGRLIGELATQTGAAIVFPKYSRAPEERYPVAIEESYAVLRQIAERGDRYQIDNSRISVAGDGTGGTIATALTLLAKQRAAPSITAQVLLYPATDAAFDTPSYQQFAEGYHLRRDAMQWFWDQYIPDAPRRNEITASPLRATTEQLTRLPPTLIITAEADVLRDEGETYATKLRAAGVPVTAVRYQATIHDFVMLNALKHTNATRAAIAQTSAYLKHALGPPR
jgi:acetyl esterase